MSHPHSVIQSVNIMSVRTSVAILGVSKFNPEGGNDEERSAIREHVTRFARK